MSFGPFHIHDEVRCPLCDAKMCQICGVTTLFVYELGQRRHCLIDVHLAYAIGLPMGPSLLTSKETRA